MLVSGSACTLRGRQVDGAFLLAFAITSIATSSPSAPTRMGASQENTAFANSAAMALHAGPADHRTPSDRSAHVVHI
jgi:methylphosphotriester-DNA--protein-cysteine methyltransferase